MGRYSGATKKDRLTAVVPFRRPEVKSPAVKKSFCPPAAWYNVGTPSPKRRGAVMEQLVIDADLRARLRNLSVPLELKDETGHVLGHFTPAFRPDDVDELLKTCPVSE